MTKKKVAVVTGKRGGFDAMIPLLDLLEHSINFELFIIATDQHLDLRFGGTITIVESMYPQVIRVPLGQADGTSTSRARAIGDCVSKMAVVLKEYCFDLVVVYGDRGEALASAIAATCVGCPIAHLQGGDISGNTDDAMRHAISKLSHIHFASCVSSAERIALMGEDPANIFVVGDNHVDRLLQNRMSDTDLAAKYPELCGANPYVCLYHSETIRKVSDGDRMSAILKALEPLPGPKVVIYPCSDVGFEPIIESFKSFLDRDDYYFYENIPSEYFHAILKKARFLIGNSSAGIIEAAYIGLPVINIGLRQLGRERPNNVVDCDDVSLLGAIIGEVMAWPSREYPMLYGNGDSAQRIFEILSGISDYSRLLTKRFMIA